MRCGEVEYVYFISFEFHVCYAYSFSPSNWRECSMIIEGKNASNERRI